MPNNSFELPLDKLTFYKFKRLYIIAFLLIIISIIVAQIFIQSHLNSQLNDSRIINIAGRQRMLSQKLVKEVLYLFNLDSENERMERIGIINSDNKAFKRSHKNLQDEFNELGKFTGNNPKLKKLFSEIESYQFEISRSSENIYSMIVKEPSILKDSLITNINNLKINESLFLKKMELIVFKFEEISKENVSILKQKEYVLLIISLAILLFEILFIFKPLSHHIRKTIRDLIGAKDETSNRVIELKKLYTSTESSLEELQGINYAIDNAALFASIAEDGSVLHISKKFIKLLEIEENNLNIPFVELLHFDQKEQQSIQELLKGKRRSIWIGEVDVTTGSEQRLWLEMSIIPMNQIKNNQRVLILCTDISKRKQSQKEIDELNEQRFLKEVSLQKTQASQIVEAQEEERKRIAKDIHDGIGQMLTALKFNIESINASNVEATEVKVERLKDFLSSLIKEVRTVTFNLTPPELKDYGIVPTLYKLADRLSGLTGKNIYFENITNFNGRFDSLVETNLYRVVQEAVNNALKYAKSNYILISLSHSEEILSIVIDDDGKGFELEKFANKNKEIGMGIFFMKERISYINGRLFINSKENKGTRITININLKSKLDHS